MAGDPFDQFDAPNTASNPFDQFDSTDRQQATDGGPNFLQRSADWLTAGVTGSRTEPSISRTPTNLELPLDKAAQMTALLATTASDDRLRGGISRIIPEAQFETDDHGNLVVIAPVTGDSSERNQWVRFYPNPSGLGAADVMQGSGALSLGGRLAAGAKLLFGASAAASIPAAAVIGGTEAGLVEAISSRLSGDRFRVADIPLGAAGGAIGGKLGQVLSGWTSSAPDLFDASGAFSPAAIRFFTRRGVNVEELGPEVAAQVREAVMRGVDPFQAVAVADAAALPIPVTMTRGQASRSVSHQLLETEAAKGTYGEAARNMMQGAFERQQQQLTANIPAMQDIVAGGAGSVPRGAGASAAQATLAATREAERRAAGELYDRARAAGGAVIRGPYAGEMADSLRASIRDFAPEASPNTNAIVGRIEEELAASGDVTRLFALRAQLNQAGAPGTPDQAAASAVKQRLDDLLARAVDDALLFGNPEVVTAYAAAIRNYADFASRWKSGGVLDSLTETTSRDGVNRVLVVAPEDAANYIFGRSANGMISKTNLIRDLRTLQDTLPPDQWNALRQEAFLKIFDQSQRSGTGDITGTTFSRLWSQFRRENPALLRQLFSEDEQALFSRFAAVATRVSNTARNNSNTASAFMGIAPLIASALGKTTLGRLALTAPLIGAAMRGVKTAQVMGGQSARMTPTITGAFGMGAGAGGAAAASPDVQRSVTGNVNAARGILGQ